MSIARVAQVVWYVTGRFYASQSNTLEDVGYFLHLQGIDDPLFDGPVSEATALLTFASEQFSASTVTNGGLNIGLDAKGAFSIFLREKGGASFDDPRSFAAGQCIATFERTAIVSTAGIPETSTFTLSTNVFTARLASSEPFELGGARYDFRDLIGFGITQWGIAATEPLTPPAGYVAVVPFVGSAIRVA